MSVPCMRMSIAAVSETRRRPVLHRGDFADAAAGEERATLGLGRFVALMKPQQRSLIRTRHATFQTDRHPTSLRGLAGLFV